MHQDLSLQARVFHHFEQEAHQELYAVNPGQGPQRLV